MWRLSLKILICVISAIGPVYGQDKKLIVAIEKLPLELRADFIKDQIKELYKHDTLAARKEVNNLLLHFANDKRLRATILLQKGAYLFKTRQTNDALLAVSEAEKLFVAIKDQEGEFDAIGSYVSIYRELNQLNEITAIVLKKLEKSSGDIERECLLSERLGIIFKEQRNFERSLYYFMQAQEKYDQIKNPNEKVRLTQISIDRNIGVHYRNQGDFEKALYHLNKALAQAELENSGVQIAAILNSLGTLYWNKKDFQRSIQVYERSLKLKTESENASGIATTCGNLSEVYLEINNFIKAESYALEAYKYGVLSKDRIKVMHACERVSDVYSKMNKRDKAFPYLKRAFTLRDTIYKASVAEQSSKLEAQYDNEKKKKEIELSKLKNKQLEESVNARSRERNMILGGSLVLVVLLGFAIKSYLDKKKANNLLEDKNTLIVTQKQMVEEQHKEIVDSITYAKRLQDAILPPENELKKHLKDYFIYYHPKSIVAGDFYWMESVGEVILLAVADCTGHGVPGAMVSLVCSNALNRSIFEYGVKDPGKILDRTRELVLENFSKSQSDVKDGMDISLLSINQQTNEVKWAGANNPLWYVKNGEFMEITANKQPIGKADNYIPFTTHSLQLQKGDSIFLFSDGYADQFGGPNGKKLKYKKFQQILVDGSKLPLAQTEQNIRHIFEEWKGDLEQVDDVCVLGIRM